MPARGSFWRAWYGVKVGSCRADGVGVALRPCLTLMSGPTLPAPLRAALTQGGRWPLRLALALGLAGPLAGCQTAVGRSILGLRPGGETVARAHHNPLLWLALNLGVALAILAVVMMVLVVAMRVKSAADEDRTERLLKRWRPLVMKRILDVPAKMPHVAPADWPTLMSLWNHLHESLRGDAREKLNRVGKEIGMREEARRYLASTDPRRQLLALLVLGNFRDGQAWPKTKELVQSENVIMSLAALRAMLMINPRVAMPIVTPLIARRTDWSPVRVAAFLSDAGEDATAKHLAKGATRMQGRDAIRLLKYIQATNARSALPAVRQLAQKTKDPGVLAAALPLLKEGKDRDLQREMMKHPSWFVRVQAAQMMGRMGQPGDEEALMALLSDEQWWVRYRAAQAIASLPFLGLDQIRWIQAHHEDRYAREILDQVLAESSLA